MTDPTIVHSRQYAQITQMVRAQAGLNEASYAKAWEENGSKDDYDPAVWDYPLAAAQEMSEFLNSWGYAWWGVKEFPHVRAIDLANCMTELVDAWHFITSQAIIEESGDTERASYALLRAYASVVDSGLPPVNHRYVVIKAKTLMANLATYHTTSATLMTMYEQFFTVLLGAGFSLDHFTTRYMAKLALNQFRQANGYSGKPRTYVKLWEDGKEDNYFLAEHVDACSQSGEVPSQGDLMKWIAATYTNKTGIKANMPELVVDEEEDES